MARINQTDENGFRNCAGVNYGELIRRFRKAKRMSQEELGAVVRVGKNAVGAWESGRSRPDMGSIPLICECLGISIDEFYGVKKDSSFTDETESHTYSPVLEKYNRLNPYHQKIILHEMDALYELQEKTISVRELIQIYRNDLSACAGPSLGIGDDSGEKIWLYQNTVPAGTDEIIRVSGNSMEPLFHDGDEVLVQHKKSIHPGEIGIFVNGNTGYIKEYRKEGLRSLNPEYQIMRFSEEDEVRCIGKVVGRLENGMIATEADIELFQSSKKRKG